MTHESLAHGIAHTGYFHVRVEGRSQIVEPEAPLGVPAVNDLAPLTRFLESLLDALHNRSPVVGEDEQILPQWAGEEPLGRPGHGG